MDGIGNKRESLNVAAPRVDHSARMERVDTALQEQNVAVAQLSPQQASDFRAYAGSTMENINTVAGLGPATLPDREAKLPAGATGIDVMPRVKDAPTLPNREVKFPPVGTGGLDLPKDGILEIGGKPKTPEQREKELEEKIREKTDPEFAARKKAERTARQLNALLNPFTIPLGGFGGPLNPKEAAETQNKRDEAQHQGDLEIVDVLYGLSGKEMSAVKGEYEKSFGKTLEEEIRRHFRGDVQQKLLAVVAGGGGGGKGGAAPAG